MKVAGWLADREHLFYCECSDGEAVVLLVSFFLLVDLFFSFVSEVNAVEVQDFFCRATGVVHCCGL